MHFKWIFTCVLSCTSFSPFGSDGRGCILIWSRLWRSFPSGGQWSRFSNGRGCSWFKGGDMKLLCLSACGWSLWRGRYVETPSSLSWGFSWLKLGDFKSASLSTCRWSWFKFRHFESPCLSDCGFSWFKVGDVELLLGWRCSWFKADEDDSPCLSALSELSCLSAELPCPSAELHCPSLESPCLSALIFFLCLHMWVARDCWEPRMWPQSLHLCFFVGGLRSSP